MNPRRRDTSDAEEALVEWAAWVMSCLEAQGWGGGVDFDIVTNIIYGKPQRGGHSNPPLAELIATEADTQGLCQRVHRHLQRYAKEKNRYWLLVPWARFVGKPEAKDWKDIPSHGTIEVGTGVEFPIDLVIRVPRLYRWSGLQQWTEVAKLTRVSERTAKGVMSLVKRQLEMDLRIDRYVMRGQLLPDGVESRAEREAMEAERVKREQREAETGNA